MRIISVVTLITPTGEYGGPVRVAVNQAAALRARGHEVTLVAATRGFGTVPTEYDGVPVTLFDARTVLPGAGFAGLAAPALWRWLRQHVDEADVVHVHAARDLVTLPAAAIARSHQVPYVLQTHGMIDPSSNPLARPLDAALTRPVLRDASAVFYLTGFERDRLLEVASPIRVQQLSNGVPFAEADPPPAERPEVLYLARLAPRKRPRVFVEAATALGKRFDQAEFALVGPDEGEGAAVRAAIQAARTAGTRITWEGPLAPELTGARMRRASIYVLPSVDEPYPMSVLEAMALGRPVIVTDTCGLAGLVRRGDAGIVVDESAASLIAAIGTLLADPAEAAAMGARGRDLVRTELSMDAIAAALETHYAATIS